MAKNDTIEIQMTASVTNPEYTYNEGQRYMAPRERALDLINRGMAFEVKHA